KFEVLREQFLLIDGVLQNQDGVVSVKAGRIAGLPDGGVTRFSLSAMNGLQGQRWIGLDDAQECGCRSCWPPPVLFPVL
ncbi:MAG: polymerase alpha subunit, partial [Candidatus Solibacter sp.]|nr:polymerase alpha subunit [Candidatus Solibacter sp.]